MSHPLFVTGDDTLLDELLRLAAAAGVTPEVARDGGAARRSWNAAPLVLIGADVAGDVARLAPTRRARVHLVCWGPAPEHLFRTALSVGAENVADLPRAEGWLTETLTDLSDTSAARGLVLGVMGGSGGAGATTFACAVAQVASASGPAVVIDADVLGPGVDRVLGLEREEGFRWDALGQATGRLSARSLREALPRRGSLGALSWYAGAPDTVAPVAMREALSAARRGHDTVVVDLPRSDQAVLDEVGSRCDRVLVVVVPTVAGVASTARVCARFPAPSTLGLVVRGRGIDPDEIARITGVPVVVAMSDQRGLAESIDLGLGPVRTRRAPLGRAAGEVLTRVTMMGAAA